MSDCPRIWERTHDGLFASREATAEDRAVWNVMKRWARGEISYRDVLKKLGYSPSEESEAA